MKLPDDLHAEYPALRLITKGIVTPSELDKMSIDDVDDLSIVLAAEEAAMRRLHRRMQPRSKR